MSALEQAVGGPAIEVVAKATRRQFTLEYKRKVVREADGCKSPGAVGALLRREGLYSSHLTTWRAARERGDLAGAPKKRGRLIDPPLPPRHPNPEPPPAAGPGFRGNVNWQSCGKVTKGSDP